MAHRFDQEDEGKPVCTADGVPIGTITEVAADEVYVEPKEGLLERYGSLFSSCWRQGTTYRLDTAQVGQVTDGEIRLVTEGGDTVPGPRT